MSFLNGLHPKSNFLAAIRIDVRRQGNRVEVAKIFFHRSKYVN